MSEPTEVEQAAEKKRIRAALEQRLEAVEDEKYPPIPADGTALRELGKRLTELLDAEHWNSVEPLLFEIQTDQQAAIDAALESVARYVESAKSIIPGHLMAARNEGLKDVSEFILSRIGTNPLAERDARIATLEARLAAAEAENEQLRGPYIMQAFGEETLRKVQAEKQKAIDDETKNPWKSALINELVVDHIYTVNHETDPRKALADVISWNCRVVLDPSVSKEARDLRQQAIDAALESLKTSCPACEYDEADGYLVDHCQECQRKIVTNLYSRKITSALPNLRANLSEAQSRIAELERDLAEARKDQADALLHAEVTAAIKELEDSASPFDSACTRLRDARYE